MFPVKLKRQNEIRTKTELHWDLRGKAERADRLARAVGDNLTIDRLKSLSAEYRQRADQLSITPETALATEPGSRQSKLIYRTPVRLRRTLDPEPPPDGHQSALRLRHGVTLRPEPGWHPSPIHKAISSQG